MKKSSRGSNRLLVAMLGITLFLELALTLGGFFMPAKLMTEFGITFTPDTQFLGHVLAWMLLAVSLTCAVALREVLAGRAIGWTLTRVLGLWWIGIGLALAFGFGRYQHLVLDSLKGLLLIAATYTVKPGKAATFLLVALGVSASPLLVHADDALPAFAKVTSVTGTVVFEGKDLESGQDLTGPGTAVTSHDSRATIQMAAGHVISLRPDTQVKLGATDEHELLKGVARFTIAKAASPGAKPTFRVRTRSAVMGVRGTDFMNVVSPLLGETEIVVFEGTVDFGSATNAKDHKLIKQGHWGGIGGRFGAKITKPIHLPAEVLGAFDRSTSGIPR